MTLKLTGMFCSVNYLTCDKTVRTIFKGKKVKYYETVYSLVEYLISGKSFMKENWIFTFYMRNICLFHGSIIMLTRTVYW